jgi:hypothetical protein
MSQIIDHRTALDKTVRIFDSFYSFDAIINASEYDIVYSYFISVCATKNIAANFTAVLFRVAQETKIPVLQLIDQIKGKKKMEINQILAYYLNSFKSKTSLYGIATVPKSNQPVSRNIVQ